MGGGGFLASLTPPWPGKAEPGRGCDAGPVPLPGQRFRVWNLSEGSGFPVPAVPQLRSRGFFPSSRAQIPPPNRRSFVFPGFWGSWWRPRVFLSPKSSDFGAWGAGRQRGSGEGLALGHLPVPGASSGHILGGTWRRFFPAASRICRIPGILGPGAAGKAPFREPANNPCSRSSRQGFPAFPCPSLRNSRISRALGVSPHLQLCQGEARSRELSEPSSGWNSGGISWRKNPRDGWDLRSGLGERGLGFFFFLGWVEPCRAAPTAALTTRSLRKRRRPSGCSAGFILGAFLSPSTSGAALRREKSKKSRKKNKKGGGKG